MPLFIVLCLAISFIVQIDHPIQYALISPWLTYGGVGCATLIMLGSIIKKLTHLMWFDLFASSILIAWFSHWKPLYVHESPMFFFFPVYFILLTAVVSVLFIGQREKIDQESLQYLHRVSQHSLAQPWLVMLYSLVSLNLLEHFLQYPVAMTLLILRFSLSGCLQDKT